MISTIATRKRENERQGNLKSKTHRKGKRKSHNREDENNDMTIV